MASTVDTRVTEDRIFDAALTIFARKGKDGARMQEIADEAGINKALLHYYFRSKDHLYERVFEYVMQRLERSFGEVLVRADSVEDVLSGFIGGYIDFVRQNLDVMRLMVNEHLTGSPMIARRLQAIMESSDTMPPVVFVRKIEQAVDRGLIRPIDSLQLLITVMSSCIFFFIIFPTIRAIHPLAAIDSDRFIEARKVHLIDLFYRSLTADEPSEVAG
jgi:TetR/AcrR family transcriptional regulator